MRTPANRTIITVMVGIVVTVAVARVVAGNRNVAGQHHRRQEQCYAHTMCAEMRNELSPPEHD